jgi:hypothetical protein
MLPYGERAMVDAIFRSDLALRYMLLARHIVSKQELLIRQLRGKGEPTAADEDLLQNFKRLLEIFEADLAAAEFRPSLTNDSRDRADWEDFI